ncbi:winged helix-turn-helix domain-containing protein [Haloterrigena alkaliphila]|uniref:Winged helix-turn-helix domain-containing protein n=1 Tax=Haloterrigena alkaliphila TaxID=2816475 RepID=A0A8A2VAV1_9EURY|nr:winged helix-turn-helix domain-containing protein [Haloterrigena alkaliphila]QSW98246.1 winged helix-turn-helix domain-containing protein [Haloterrigena alkaliphila]
MANGGTEATRRTGGEQDAPRAIIHKQILDHADENPAAAMEAIADAVSGATTATVERVLEEYGDPAADESDGEVAAASDTEPSPAAAVLATPDGQPATDGGATSELAEPIVTESSTTEEPVTTDRDEETEPRSESGLDRSELTEKQRETLREVYERPDATQAELADRLGVSSPTISQRVNSIDGFDWSDRHALVASLFETDGDEREDGGMTHTNDTDPASSGGDADERTNAESNADQSDEDAADVSAHDRRLTELAERIDELTQQVATVERELTALERPEVARESDPSVLADPELAHKIIHACMRSDRITEEEELRLLRDVTAASAVAEPDTSQSDST